MTLNLRLATALAGLTMLGCGGGAQAVAASEHHATPLPTVTVAATAPTPVATTAVDIANFAFSPTVITVRAGDTVTWMNNDQEAHTVAISGVALSKPLQNADTYTHTFGQPGTYSYICTIHPYMHGMVIVNSG